MYDLNIIHSEGEYSAAINLFKEYAAWLGIDLSFQHFEEELQSLKEMYNEADGGLILCKKENEYIGCVAIRRIDSNTAELKRMYVQPACQQQGVGKKLLEHALTLAQNCNYSFVNLDTLNHMLPAIKLYKKYGFYEIAAYYHNPVASAVYFQKKL